MSILIRNARKKFARMERGQVLVIVALAAVGIIAIVGLALDVGVMFIENARLRRAVDSAALAAALQYRANYDFNDLDRSAIEFLSLNGIHDPNALVQVCMDPAPSPIDPDYLHYNEDLCTDPARKLVGVYATGTAQLAFLPVIGIESAPIAAEATSETASVDVVLVIDRSESMTWDATDTEKLDPSVCNNDGTSGDGYVGDCHPLDEVKRAAVSFVEQLYFPYDRVSVVTFDKNACVVMEFSNVQGDIINTIKGLTVYQGEETDCNPTSGINAIYPNGNPSRWYDPNGVYYGLQCPQTDPDLQASYPDFPSPAPCTTTNIGAGLYTAGGELASARQGSLWVVILLTDGVANAGYDDEGQYFCPESTWDNSAVLPEVLPKCNDGRTESESNPRPPAGSADYDAEDYAYDGADFVAHDQNALIFTIGLGTQVEAVSTVDGTKLGELFLQYAADQGLGLYSHATTAELREVFRQIAENIATRLAH
jgi:Flp pilus assembly protein TadG